MIEGKEAPVQSGKEPAPPLPLHERIFGQVEVRIAIKAGVAATLSLYMGSTIAYLFNRPDYLLSGTWCVLSTFAVLQANLGGTYRAAWIRFLGVMLGSFMGGLFTSLFGSNAISLGVSVVLTMLICSLLNLKDSIRIACLSLSVVIILWGLHPLISPWKFGMYRFFDSTVGILIAVLVSHLIWPSQASSTMREILASALDRLNRLFQLELTFHLPGPNFLKVYWELSQEIGDLLEEAKVTLSDSELELLAKSRSLTIWENLIDHLHTLFKKTCELQALQIGNLNKILDPELKIRLGETVETVSSTILELSAKLRGEVTEENIEKLPLAFAGLNEELNRFRKTHVTRQFEREDVEQFFVFFYNLRSLIEELLKMREKVSALLSETS